MFGIENSKDRLQLLEENFSKLREDPLNISLAEHACSDAWHLIDWILVDKKETDPTLTKEQFRIKVYKDCPEIKILHDLANSIKHKELNSPKVRIVRTRKHGGNFNSDFSKDFNVSRLEIHFEDDTKIDLDDLVKTAIGYWNQLLNEY